MEDSITDLDRQSNALRSSLAELVTSRILQKPKSFATDDAAPPKLINAVVISS